MNKRLFIAGLPFSTTSDELKELFMGVGTPISSVVITDRDSGISKGFGFVEMETEEEAQNAINKLDGEGFGGRKLIVNFAKPKEDKPREGNGYGNRSDKFGGSRRFSGDRRDGRWGFNRKGGSFRGGRGGSNRH